MKGKQKKTQPEITDEQRKELERLFEQVQETQDKFWTDLAELEECLERIIDCSVDLEDSRDYHSVDLETLIEEARG